MKRSSELFDRLDEFEKDTVFYFDRHLGEDQMGEEIAKKIYDLGYSNLYMTSDHKKYIWDDSDEFDGLSDLSDSNFVKPDWIIEVIDKNPPF